MKDWKDGAGNIWVLGSEREREAAYLAACDRAAALAGPEREREVGQIESDLGIKLPAESGQLMMTWEQVRRLSQHGHIVGSHTMTHPNLAHVAIEDARRELVESKGRMEARVNAKVVHFSYPCPALSPNWNERTAQESQRAGYETAVTTSSGLARKNDNPLMLKRVRPSKTVDGLRWNLETAFAGREV